MRDDPSALSSLYAERPAQLTTISDLLRQAARRLQAAGVCSPALDARLLLGHALGRSREQLQLDHFKTITTADAARFEVLLTRRIAREPVSRILGRREFWSLEFDINADTLDPRADSETLIGAALDLIKDSQRPLRILDLGTGSGCLLLALLSEFPNASGIGADISPGALDVARANAARLGFASRAQFIECDLRAADWPQRAGGPFDLLIANPPYIPDAQIAALAPEVARHDPRLALAGGDDGLDFYRLITISMRQVLAARGVVILEAGQGQPPGIAALLRAQHVETPLVYCDLSGIERAVVGRLCAVAGEAP